MNETLGGRLLEALREHAVDVPPDLSSLER